MARKKTTPQSNDPAALFTPIGSEPPADGPSVEDQLKALSEQVGNLGKQLGESQSRNEKLAGMVQMLAAARPAATKVAADTGPSVPTLDVKALPDPTKDPQGYAKAISEHADAVVNARVGAATQANNRRQAQDQRLEQLWEKFGREHKDLAEYRDIAEFVAGKMVREAVASGADPEAYIFGTDNGATFMENVAKSMNERITAIRGTTLDDDDGEGADDDDAPEPRDAQGNPLQRTIGIPGNTSGAPTGGGKKAPQQESNMVSELKEQQKGIYY